MAALSGIMLLRERRVGLPRALDSAAVAIFRRAIAAGPPATVPVIVLPLDDIGIVRAAQSLLDDGLLIEVLLDRWTDELRQDEASAAALAAVLRRAWRISIIRDSDGRAALPELVTECIAETGAIDAFA
jgi:hypothetical protein